MQRIPAIAPDKAVGTAKLLLERIQAKTGMVSNQVKTMAASPAALEACLGFDAALDAGTLSTRLREGIALTVAEANGCDYSLAVHCAFGRMAGLSAEEIQDSRRGYSPDRKLETALQFARRMVQARGRVTDDDMAPLLKLGYGHGEIIEIAANVILAIFTNYFNLMAGTARDFPEAPSLAGDAEAAMPPGISTNHTQTLS